MDSTQKRLLFRARHRGTAENGMILGGFAERTLEKMTPAQLAEFGALLDAGDPDLFLWITGAAPVPESLDGAVMAMLKNYIKKPDLMS